MLPKEAWSPEMSSVVIKKVETVFAGPQFPNGSPQQLCLVRDLSLNVPVGLQVGCRPAPGGSDTTETACSKAEAAMTTSWGGQPATVTRHKAPSSLQPFTMRP